MSQPKPISEIMKSAMPDKVTIKHTIYSFISKDGSREDFASIFLQLLAGDAIKEEYVNKAYNLIKESKSKYHVVRSLSGLNS